MKVPRAESESAQIPPCEKEENLAFIEPFVKAQMFSDFNSTFPKHINL